MPERKEKTLRRLEEADLCLKDLLKKLDENSEGDSKNNPEKDLIREVAKRYLELTPKFRNVEITAIKDEILDYVSIERIELFINNYYKNLKRE